MKGGLLLEDLQYWREQPPEQLQAMWRVSRGEAVEAGWSWLVDLKDRQPREFVKDLERAEATWRKLLEALPSGKAEGEVSEEKGVVVAERWLREHKEDGDDES